jgi:hypothetical protein
LATSPAFSTPERSARARRAASSWSCACNSRGRSYSSGRASPAPSTRARWNRERLAASNSCYGPNSKPAGGSTSLA